MFISVADSDKRAVILPAHRLQELGFRLVATEGTAEILARNGIAVEVVNKFSATQESGETNIVDLINAGEIDIVVNTPSGGMARADGYEIRAAAVAADKALFTTMAVLGAAVSALSVLGDGFRVKSLQEYAADRGARRHDPAISFGERVRAALAVVRPALRRDRPARRACSRRGGLDASAAGVREFGLRVVDAAAGRVGIVKPQVSFFERYGSAGFAALEDVMRGRARGGSARDRRRQARRHRVDDGCVRRGVAHAGLAAGGRRR